MIVWKNVPLIPLSLVALAIKFWHMRVSRPICQVAMRYLDWIQKRSANNQEVPRG